MNRIEAERLDVVDPKEPGFLTYEQILETLSEALPPVPVADFRQPFSVVREPRRFLSDWLGWSS